MVTQPPITKPTTPAEPWPDATEQKLGACRGAPEPPTEGEDAERGDARYAAMKTAPRKSVGEGAKRPSVKLGR